MRLSDPLCRNHVVIKLFNHFGTQVYSDLRSDKHGGLIAISLVQYYFTLPTIIRCKYWIG